MRKFIIMCMVVMIHMMIPCCAKAAESNKLLYRIDIADGLYSPTIINEFEMERIEPNAFFVADEYWFLDDTANNRILIYERNKFINEILLQAEMDVQMLYYNDETLSLIYRDRFEDSASIYYYASVNPFSDSKVANIESINSKEEILLDCYFDAEGNLVTEYKEASDNTVENNILETEQEMRQITFYNQDVKLISEYAVINNKGIVKECIYDKNLIYVPEMHESALKRGHVLVNKKGEIFQLVVTENSVEVYKLKGHQIDSADATEDYLFLEGLYLERIAADFSLYERHENASTTTTSYPQMADFAIRSRMDTYKNLTWTYNSNRNADLSVTSEPNNVAQPGWLSAYNDGQNHSVTNVPYCWGGWNAESFVSKINQGKYAGNVCTITNYVINGTVGMDCSGYVSVAYNLPYKHGTTNMTNCFTAYSTVQNVEPYDILCKSGSHVMIVVLTYYANGIRYVDTYEESCSSGKIIYKTGRKYQDLLSAGYIPMKYDYFVRTLY